MRNWLEHPYFRALPSLDREILFRRHKRQSWKDIVLDITEEVAISEQTAKNVYRRAIQSLKEAE